MSYRLVFRPAVAAGRAKKVLSPWLIAEASISISRCPLGASVGVGTSQTSSSRVSVTHTAFTVFSFRSPMDCSDLLRAITTWTLTFHKYGSFC